MLFLLPSLDSAVTIGNRLHGPTSPGLSGLDANLRRIKELIAVTRTLRVKYRTEIDLEVLTFPLDW